LWCGARARKKQGRGDGGAHFVLAAPPDEEENATTPTTTRGSGRGNGAFFVEDRQAN